MSGVDKDLVSVGGTLDLFKADRVAPSVVERVRRYDPQLLIGWDSSCCRWGLLRAWNGKVNLVTIIEGPNGEYIPLDDRVLDWMVANDMWRFAKRADRSIGDQYADAMEEKERAVEEKTERDLEGDWIHATRDNKTQLGRVLDFIRR